MVSAQILIAAERSGRGQHKSLLAGWSRSRRHGNIGQGCRCDGTELGENFTFQSVKLSGDSKQKKFSHKKSGTLTTFFDAALNYSSGGL